MNPTWKQFRPAATNELAYSTLTLPSIYVAISAWVGYSVCLRKTDIDNVEGFSLQPLAEPISDEYVLCVSYPVSDTQSVRYKLWEGVGEVVSATLYQGQLIGPGAYLELWTTINSPNPLSITEDIVIETGLTYSRLGGNGGCSGGSDSGNCFGGGGSGTQGPPGPPGEAATIAVGTTTTLDPGEDATVTNSGSSSAAVFNFGIPRGEQGPPGEGTVEVGDTITGAPGTDASVTNVGTPTDVILEFTIPRGDTGAIGPAPSGTGVVVVNSGVAAVITTSAELAAKISDETGSGALVFANSPTLVTPALGTPSSGNLSNCTFPTLNQNTTGNAATATALQTGRTINGTLFDGTANITITVAPPSGTGLIAVTGGVYDAPIDTSAALAAKITDETGSGSLVFATSPTLVTPLLGTPTSGNLSNCTAYPVAQLTGLGANVATFLATPSSANLAAAVTDETGTGALVFATSPTLVTPVLGTPASGTLTNCTGPWVRTIGDTMTGQLAIASGTLTASAPALDLSQTWNNAAVAFTGIKFNVTDTTSSSSSLLFDFQYNGTTRINGTRGGSVNLSQLIIVNDVVLVRDAAYTLGQRNGTNPQRSRIYNTYTDSSNYERGFVEWVSNVFRIGTEKLGTGVARALEFITDGTTRLTISTTGAASFSSTVSSTYQRFGSGTPEGAVTAPVGAFYSRTDGGAGTSFYVKESGSGNTGWVAK